MTVFILFQMHMGDDDQQIYYRQPKESILKKQF